MEEPSVLDYIKSLLKDWRQLSTRLRTERQKQARETPSSSEAVANTETIIRTTVQEETCQSPPSLTEAVELAAPTRRDGPTIETTSAEVTAEPTQAISQQVSRTERLAILSGLSALALSLFAQASLEPPNPDATFGIILYGIAAAVLLFASLRSYLEIPLSPPPLPQEENSDSFPYPEESTPKGEGRAGKIKQLFASLRFTDKQVEARSAQPLETKFGNAWIEYLGPPLFSQRAGREMEFRLHLPAFGAALITGALAFLAFGSGDFNALNLLLWGLSLGLIVRSFYPFRLFNIEWLIKAIQWLEKSEWQVRITRWTVLFFLTMLVLLFFRFYRLAEVPPEMVSDHAEKLLDVADVLDGKWHIFYPRNTGREAFQMFLTAAMAKLFGTGLSFMSLKLGTTIAGVLTLVYLYLLGKEIANRRVGLFAMFLAGVSYWLNVITRVGLRFSLYPLFAAPTLYYLIRGLRQPNAKDFILCGLFLGLGLHGYSPFRLVPFVVLAAVGLALLHRTTQQSRRAMIIGLMIAGIVSIIIFLPLLRYALQNPEIFFYRGLTRLTDVEKPLDQPALEIFFSNLWKALIMFFWNNGSVWVVSIPGRPALSVVSAALLFIGGSLVLVRYLRRFEWLDLFLLVSIPLLLLPSVLSLAFPDENPILNRTSGAIVPVFILAALGLEALIRPFENAFRRGWQRSLGWLLALCVLGLGLLQDYDLVFRQYYTQYAQSAWNTSQMGKIIHEFATTIGTPDTAWVVAYPHWVDTRLVGMNAGFPLKDYAIWPDQLEETLAFEGPKLFIVKPEDTAGLEALQRLYPWGTWQEQLSPWEGKIFYVYFVPPGAVILPEESNPIP